MMLKKLLSAFTLFTLLLAPLATQAQSDGRNGGLRGAQYITEQMREALVRLSMGRIRSQSISYEKFSELQTIDETIRNLLRSASLQLVTTPLYGNDGLERDAINNGVDLIQMNLLRFAQMNPVDRLALLLHEYVSLGGFEKSDAYGISTWLMTLINYPAQYQTDFGLELPEFGETKTFSLAEISVRNAYPMNHFNLALNFCKTKGYTGVQKTLEETYFHRLVQLPGKCTPQKIAILRAKVPGLYKLEGKDFVFYEKYIKTGTTNTDDDGNPTPLQCYGELDYGNANFFKSISCVR